MSEGSPGHREKLVYTQDSTRGEAGGRHAREEAHHGVDLTAGDGRLRVARLLSTFLCLILILTSDSSLMVRFALRPPPGSAQLPPGPLPRAFSKALPADLRELPGLCSWPSATHPTPSNAGPPTPVACSVAGPFPCWSPGLQASWAIGFRPAGPPQPPC